MTSPWAHSYADADTAPFWEALGRHELRAQRCMDCGHLRFPPGPCCPKCWSDEAEWALLSGRGRVLSWVVSHHVTHPVFAQIAPYIVVFVELLEQTGLLMYGRLISATDAPRYLMPVEVVWEDSEGFTLAQWGPRPNG